MELPLCPFWSFLRCRLPPPRQDAHWVVFYALISCWQVLSCQSRDLRSPRMFLQDPDGRCPLSNKQAGSSQMRPRWWHYLSTGIEPGEGCWARVGASLGQPCVWWRAWPGLEGWCYVDSNYWPAAGLLKVAPSPNPDTSLFPRIRDQSLVGRVQS